MDATHIQIRRQLEAQFDRLVQRVGRIEDDLRSLHDDDWAERAIEVQNDPVLESLDASDRLELAAIRSALVRMDEGTYGTCSKCGKRIDERRLKAMPTATVCLACAKSNSGSSGRDRVDDGLRPIGGDHQAITRR